MIYTEYKWNSNSKRTNPICVLLSTLYYYRKNPEHFALCNRLFLNFRKELLSTKHERLEWIQERRKQEAWSRGVAASSYSGNFERGFIYNGRSSDAINKTSNFNKQHDGNPLRRLSQRCRAMMNFHASTLPTIEPEIREHSFGQARYLYRSLSNATFYRRVFQYTLSILKKKKTKRKYIYDVIRRRFEDRSSRGRNRWKFYPVRQTWPVWAKKVSIPWKRIRLSDPV